MSEPKWTKEPLHVEEFYDRGANRRMLMILASRELPAIGELPAHIAKLYVADVGLDAAGWNGEAIPEQRRADAQRFAAAPRLYVALEALLNRTDELDGLQRREWDAEILNALGALALARGEAMEPSQSH